jgi:hypothetical protein
VIHLLSLGAGVQSSTMALMAAEGELLPMPVGAVFADTMDEPKSVYVWLDWLEKQLPFPVYRVGKKRSISEVALEIRQRKDGTGQWSKSAVPAWIQNQDGSTGAMRRICTTDWKVVPLISKTKALIKQHGTSGAVQWIGISRDEAHRMKDSREAKIKHRWPLIELGMSRHDCLKWIEKHNLPKPPRSACVFCPYHSDKEWRRLKSEEPKEFKRAVEFEKELQAVKRVSDRRGGVPFLHRSMKPLSDVDFSTEEERGQISLFGNECEGMCGV